MSFREALQRGKFLVTAEVAPPKGTDVQEMLKGAQILKGRVDAFNVTDNQSSVLRLSSVAGCSILKQNGFEPILQATCRDRNRLGLQSDLLGATSLGIENVLVMTGDHPVVGDHPQAKPVFDLESVQLLQIVKILNQGKDMSGNALNAPTHFFPGAVVTPEAEPLQPQLLKFEKKVKAGAQFFQTQAVYNSKKFAQFMEFAQKFKVKILAGILLLKSARMARYLNKKVPGITVPNEFVRRLEKASNPIQEGVKIAVKLIQELKQVCDGVHIMAVGAEKEALQILKYANIR